MTRNIIQVFFDSMRNHRTALVIAILVGLLVLVNQFWTGLVYGSGQTRQLLHILRPSIDNLTLASVSMSATTLGLMLTLLGLMHKAEQKFDNDFYRTILEIGALCSVTLILTTVMLSINSIPVEETDNVANRWFDIIYYVLITMAATVSGLLVNIIVLLFQTVRSLIYTMHFEEDEPAQS